LLSDDEGFLDCLWLLILPTHTLPKRERGIEGGREFKKGLDFSSFTASLE